MVLVSYPYRFIYLKTHKTASTSVEMAFEPFCSPPGTVVTTGTPARHSAFGIVGARGDDIRGGSGGARWPREEPVWIGHMTARRLRRNLRIDRWWRSFKFATVRNPFDRAVSKFLFKRRLRGLPALTSIDEMRAEFRPFILGEDYAGDRKIVFIGRRCVLDDVVRYEDVDGEIRRIARRIGLPEEQIVLPHARDNSSARLGYSVEDFFTPELIERVRQVDDWIFRIGGYPEYPVTTQPVAAT